MKKTLFFAAALAMGSLGSVTAQTTLSLSTLFASNNAGSLGGMVYYDIKVTNAVRIVAFDVNYSAVVNTAVGINVFTVSGTSVGKETNKSAWKLVGKDNGKAKAAGRGSKTKITLVAPIILTPGSYGIALEAVGSGHAYTNGTATNTSYKDKNIALTLGKASNVPFTANLFSPRVWNGTIFYTLAKGLFAGFDASPTAGSGPLKVQFKDGTFTSSTGGVKTWAWDLDGNGTVDSKLQNPVWTYKSVGKTAQYTVSLTVTDGVNPSSKKTEKNFITVDPQPTVDFTATPVFGNSPLIVKFTDKSVGANKWAWDFNNDGTVDSTRQHPAYPFVRPGSYTVTLSVTGVGGKASVTKKDFITAVGATSNKGSADMLQYQFNEVRGTKVANSSSSTMIPPFGSANTSRWMADAGRSAYKGPEAGAGALGTGGAIATGWKPKVNSSMTIEWWLRNRSATGSSFGYFFGNGTFRCFTGGVAGNTLWFRGTNIGDIKASTSVQGNKGKWMHVALVIDGKGKKALWYVNGKLDSSTPLSAAFSYNGSALTNGLSVGANGSTTGSATGFYDMDDFRMYSGARTAAQVAADMLRENPTTSTFDTGCAGTLGTPLIGANGAPQTGSASFAVTVDKTENGRPGVLVIGGAAKKFANAINLPFSLAGLLSNGAGCNLSVDVALAFGAVGNGGKLTFPVPIPLSISGSHVYMQWIGFGSKGAVSAGLDVNMQK